MSVLKLQQQNVTAAAAYTEYQIVVPGRVVTEFTLQCRPGQTPANIFWYTTPTNGATPGQSSNLPQSPNTYGTIPPNASRTIRGQIGAQIIYVQVDVANQVLEVDYYGDN